MTLSSQAEQQIVNRVSFVGIAGNIILSVFKFFAGIFGHSGAMVSDAVHSLSDVFATFVAWLGVRMSAKEADQEHPYGHERLECVAALILGTILALTGVFIGYEGVRKVLAGNYADLAVPRAIALWAAVISIIVKEAMYWYTRYYAKILNSSAFMADAWHHRSDAFSSIGSLVGVGGAMLGFPVLDPLASAVIAGCILKVSYDILKDAVSKMLDTSCGEEYERNLRNFMAAVPGVVRVNSVYTRQFGNKIYIDAEIAVDGNLSLTRAHDIASLVHDKVEKQFENVKHIMIHVEPA